MLKKKLAARKAKNTKKRLAIAKDEAFGDRKAEEERKLERNNSD